MQHLISKLVSAVWVLLLTLTYAFAVPAIVQSANNAVALQDDVAITFGAPVTSGNTVVCVAAGQYTPTTISSFVDDKGNNYAQSDTSTLVADNIIGWSYYLGNITNGPVTITLTVTAGQGFGLVLGCDEISGVAASTDPRDGHTVQQQIAGPTST